MISVNDWTNKQHIQINKRFMLCLFCAQEKAPFRLFSFRLQFVLAIELSVQTKRRAPRNYVSIEIYGHLPLLLSFI